MSDTTLGDTRAAAVICRERGWGPGTRLVGDEGRGPHVIEITAVGEEQILAKNLTMQTGEGLRDLSCRDWIVVVAAEDDGKGEDDEDHGTGVVKPSDEEKLLGWMGLGPMEAGEFYDECGNPTEAGREAEQEMVDDYLAGHGPEPVDARTCPHCGSQRARVITQMTSSAAIHTFTDLEGRRHSHDGNRTTGRLECLDCHRERGIDGCLGKCWCGWRADGTAVAEPDACSHPPCHWVSNADEKGRTRCNACGAWREPGEPWPGPSTDGRADASIASGEPSARST